MDKQFSIAIIGGTGNLGSALALRLGAPGVKVIIGSRDAAKAHNVVATLKPNMRAGELAGTTNQEAVKQGDFVVITVPYEGQAQMVRDLKGHLAGKIVINTVVPLKKGKPFVPPAGSALLEAQGKTCIIIVENHTIVKFSDIKKCNYSGSWGMCMPYGEGYIQNGGLKSTNDFINNIIGKPDAQKRVMYIF